VPWRKCRVRTQPCTFRITVKAVTRIKHPRYPPLPSLLFLAPTNSCSLLSRDPFTDIGRAVSEFRSVRFAERQEFYGPSVQEKDLLASLRSMATTRLVVSSQMNVDMAFSPILDLGPIAHVYPFPWAGVNAMAVI
jgi:hypothetical protein